MQKSKMKEQRAKTKENFLWSDIIKKDHPVGVVLILILCKRL